MDIIKLINLKLPVFTGVEEHERTEKTTVILNVELFCDVREAACTDDLKKTVDYQAVQDAIVNSLKNEEFLLIETIAEKAARLCLDFKYVEKVKVEIIKNGSLEHCDGAAVIVFRP
jgi:FolB domain-containing protein